MDKKRIYFVLMTVILVLAKLGSYVLASQIETLRGIKGVAVRVQVVGDGLTESQVRLDVESKLQIAGIEILVEDYSWIEGVSKPPYLYAELISMKQGKDFYCCYINIRLEQNAFLRRNPGIEGHFPTWSTDALAWGPLDYIRNRLKELMDKFLNDYLTVNPRFQKEEQRNPLDGLYQKNEPRNLIKEMEEEKRLQELEEKSIPTPEEYRRQHK